MRWSGVVITHLLVALFMTGCVQSETRSFVSQEDLPAAKYHKIAVFIENLNEREVASAQGVIVATLQRNGINAVAGSDVFEGQGELSEKAKAGIVQKEFDAVLYITVLEEGLTEEVIPGAQHNGQSITFFNPVIPGVLNTAFSTDIGIDHFILRPDGTVAKPKLALHTKVDLQDTKSAKRIWASETIASGPAEQTNIADLFAQASQQIVEKLRADGAI